MVPNTVWIINLLIFEISEWYLLQTFTDLFSLHSTNFLNAFIIYVLIPFTVPIFLYVWYYALPFEPIKQQIQDQKLRSRLHSMAPFQLKIV